eukprot:4518095-Pyramimonas_sp.AAC.1
MGSDQVEPAFDGGLAGPRHAGGPAGALFRAAAQGSSRPRTSDRVDTSLDGGILQADGLASAGRTADGPASVGVVAIAAGAPASITGS